MGSPEPTLFLQPIPINSWWLTPTPFESIKSLIRRRSISQYITPCLPSPFLYWHQQIRGLSLRLICHLCINVFSKHRLGATLHRCCILINVWNYFSLSTDRANKAELDYMVWSVYRSTCTLLATLRRTSPFWSPLYVLSYTCPFFRSVYGILSRLWCFCRIILVPLLSWLILNRILDSLQLAFLVHGYYLLVTTNASSPWCALKFCEPWYWFWTKDHNRSHQLQALFAGM